MHYLEEAEYVAGMILQGKLIVYPTDTIWGIGCSALNATSILNIHKIKQRNPQKSYVLLVDSIEMIKEYVESIHPRVETLLTLHFRPLTIIYPKAKHLPKEAVNGDGTVAIRLCQDKFCKELIRLSKVPLVSTSANISGEPFPSNFKSINPKILAAVDYVVKYRQHEKEVGEPSVIASYDDNGELIFVRE